jgi:SAM-dependent methyltransferase
VLAVLAVLSRLRRVVDRIDAHSPRPLLYRGDAVECPCCEGHFSSFRSFNRRPNAECPRCGSLERHRTLWLYLRDRTDLLVEPAAVLHFAPEPALEHRLRSSGNVRYTAADLHPAHSGIERVDIMAIPFADASFDLVLCNHVLEHVPDDRAAMRELHRVLRPGGRALLQHPIEEHRAETYEDATIVSPAQRRIAFGQADHVRVYGRDFRDRLTAPGFEVTVERFADSLAAGEIERYGLKEEGSLTRGSDIHVALKPSV